MVGNSVPGIVNANEKQQQCCRGDKEKGWALMIVSHACRYNQRYVGCEREQNMEQWQ